MERATDYGENFNRGLKTLVYLKLWRQNITSKTSEFDKKKIKLFYLKSWHEIITIKTMDFVNKFLFIYLFV